VLDLCGTTMFVDSSGDSVPIMFLQQLELLDKQSRWNWGGAVLACLYRGLCHACLVSLLQLMLFTFFLFDNNKYTSTISERQPAVQWATPSTAAMVLVAPTSLPTRNSI
jgi:Plant mobile domain